MSLLQVIWSEDHQEYGTYAQSLDGDWLWYPAQVGLMLMLYDPL